MRATSVIDQGGDHAPRLITIAGNPSEFLPGGTGEDVVTGGPWWVYPLAILVQLGFLPALYTTGARVLR